MLPALSEPVTVIRPAWGRQRGDLVADWDNAVEHDEPGCLIRPIQGDEILVDGRRRDSVVTRWALNAPLAADITGRDRVRWRGEVYQVDGEPQPVTTHSPLLDHLETQFYKVEG